jgi:hypothetical protein
MPAAAGRPLRPIRAGNPEHPSFNSREPKGLILRGLLRPAGPDGDSRDREVEILSFATR